MSLSASKVSPALSKVPHGTEVQLETIKFTLDNSYPVGGYPLSTLVTDLLSAKEKATIHDILFQSGWQGYTPVWDRTNSKLMLYRTAAINAPQEQVPDTTDVSAVVAGEATVIWT